MSKYRYSIYSGLALITVPLLVATGLLALATNGHAESAISVDKISLSYAYRVGVNLDELGKQAAARCTDIGGSNCQVVISCSKGGFGAIAVDAKKRVSGAVCGKLDEAAARGEAKAGCVAGGGAEASCNVVSIYEDRTPVFPVSRSFFAGDWSTTCGGKQIFRFKFVAFNEFQASSCACRVGTGRNCKLWRCAPVKGNYTPGQPAGTFVSPTFGKSLIKYGDELDFRTVSARQTLRRCN